METFTYTIALDARKGVEKELTRIQRGFAKYGGQLAFNWAEPRMMEIMGQYFNRNEESQPWKTAVEVADLTITLQAHDTRYELVGKVSREDGVSLLNKFGERQIPERFRNQAMCDRCGKTVTRDLYVIYDKEKEEFYGYGSQCISYVLGENTAKSLLLRCHLSEFMAVTVREGHEDWEFGGRRITNYEKEAVICAAIASTRLHGHVRTSEFNSTANEIEWFFGYNANRADSDERKNYAEFCLLIKSIRQTNLVEEILNFVLAKAEDETHDDFWQNLREITKNDFIRIKDFGRVACIYKLYQRELPQESPVKSAGRYLGTVGERLKDVACTGRLARSWETDYGMTHLYIFHDKDGNTLAWRSSKALPYFAEDSELILDGTVKAHETYQGINQTTMTRCKVRVLENA